MSTLIRIDYEAHYSLKSKYHEAMEVGVRETMKPNLLLHDQTKTHQCFIDMVIQTNIDLADLDKMGRVQALVHWETFENIKHLKVPCAYLLDRGALRNVSMW